MNAKAYAKESERRRAALEQEYVPALGVGSPLERAAVCWNEGVTLHLPLAMLEDETFGVGLRICHETGRSVEAHCKRKGIAFDLSFEHDFNRQRCRYDYEFWCATCVTIQSKDGELVPLILNPPQRQSLAAREAQRLAGKPVRQIELKHRQYGSTTEKNAYVAWHQNVLRRGWNAYVISLQQGQAAKIVARYDRIAEHYPPRAGSITLRPYYGLQNTKEILGRDCFLAIGSAKNPNAPSGDTIQGALISEAGKMSDTDRQGATKLITNITSMVPLKAGTCILIESTAEESGAWFKDEVEKAQQGRSGYAFTFISWLSDPSCTYPAEGDPAAFIESWSKYERLLWERGATLGQIQWWRMEAAQKPSHHTMLQENPSTPEEAFQHGERRVFPPRYVQALRPGNREPAERGRLVGDALTGKEALRQIAFEDDAQGPLRIWRRPGDTYGGLLKTEDEEGRPIRYAHRYVAASDVGPGQSAGADYSDTVVIDRAPMCFGGLPEVVAEWHGHADVDLYAWQAAQLATWYDRAYWAIEVNSLQRRTAEVRDPDFGLTVLDEIKGHYPNLHLREVYDNISQEVTRKAGWHTNQKTKGLLVAALTKAMRAVALPEGDEASGYVERAAEACSEMDSYLHVEGRMEAAPRRKDDRVITRGIALHLHAAAMPPVAAVVQKPRQRRKKSMATF